MSKIKISCKSETGITVGIIDSIMVLAALLDGRDLSKKAVKEALKDFDANRDMKRLFVNGLKASQRAIKL